MTTPELIGYIRESTSQGQTKEQIFQVLIQNGWQFDDINEGFSTLFPATPQPPIGTKIDTGPVSSPVNLHTQEQNSSQDNNFQRTFPLSPKKFWKKMIGKFFISFFLALPFGFIGILIPFMKNSNPNAISSGDVFGSAVIIFLISWIIILLLYAWYIRVYIRTYFYNAGDNFITIRKGVFTQTEIHVQYLKIQDVYVDQDLTDRLLGIYDVHIASATASSGIEAHNDGVDKDIAESIKNYLLNKITGHSHQQTQNPLVQTPTNSRVSFSSAERVSSKEFPIRGIWLLRKIVFTTAYSLLVTFIVLGKLSGVASEGDTTIPLVSFIVIVIFFGSILWGILYPIIWRKNYYFEFTRDFILIREKVLSTSEKHVPYSTIQDVIKTQNFVDRILGLSNVTIQNAAQSFNLNNKLGGSGGNIVIPGLSPSNAELLSTIIKNILFTKNTGQTANGL
jgi:membrane protein YdbS with pleckstrin-like domain